MWLYRCSILLKIMFISKFPISSPSVMARMLILTFTVSNGQLFAASPSEKLTHCTGEESTFFSCRIKGGAFVASLCGRSVAVSGSDQSETVVDYRYGKAGEVMFKYPETPVSINGNKFFGHHDKPYQGGYELDEVYFKRDHVDYKIYVYESTKTSAGVVVGKGKNGKLAECVDKTTMDGLSRFTTSLPESTYR